MPKANHDPNTGDRAVAPEILAAGRSFSRNPPGLTQVSGGGRASKAEEHHSTTAETSGYYLPAAAASSGAPVSRSPLAAVVATAIMTAPSSAEGEAGEHDGEIASVRDFAAMKFEPDEYAGKIYASLGTREEWMEHAASDWVMMQVALKSTSTQDALATSQMVVEMGAECVLEFQESLHRISARHSAIAAVTKSASVRWLAGVCRFMVAEGLA